MRLAGQAFSSFLGKGGTSGILWLIVLVGIVLGGILFFIIFWRRRKEEIVGEWDDLRGPAQKTKSKQLALKSSESKLTNKLTSNPRYPLNRWKR